MALIFTVIVIVGIVHMLPCLQVLMATAVIPLLHVGYTVCFWSALGKVGGLGWFFFAPVGGMIAIYGERHEIIT